MVYHLKQIGMDNKMLNGGIILTGGGSQLKHLIQLTEYTTGVSARIGYPNEHLASGHTDELTKPMYATCVGLILKGYNDYENDKQSTGRKLCEDQHQLFCERTGCPHWQTMLKTGWIDEERNDIDRRTPGQESKRTECFSQRIPGQDENKDHRHVHRRRGRKAVTV